MSTLPPLPNLSSIEAAFIDLVYAFLEQVLHIPTPVRAAIHHMEITETLESMMHKGLMGQEWAVTVVLTMPLPLIGGDTVLLAVDNRTGTYTISKLFFRPGWKPQEEQAE